MGRLIGHAFRLWTQQKRLIYIVTENITPVLLAGGSGTRLWPLSRKSYPKQFSNLIGDTSLFQQSALRLTSTSVIKFNPHIIMTHSDFRFIVGEQMQSVGIDPGPILIEPERKNTAPAILAASLYASRADANAILLVCPSDHVIPDTSAFHEVLSSARHSVEDGKIVAFGVTPTRPETGYGYLELSSSSQSTVVPLKGFVEKPDAARARAMVEAGNYLWNAGIFMFRAKDMIRAFREHANNVFMPVLKAIETATPDLGFLRLDPGAWAQCEDISIDYAIMEQVNNLVAVPFFAGWSDLGDWGAVWQEMVPDKNGVALSQNAHAIYCHNTMLRSESSAQEIVGLGLTDILAIAMPDAVLIAHKDQAQNVKSVIKILKDTNVEQAETFTKDHRPWGWFETLAIRGNFQVKKIFVNPGAALSLQSHQHRSEHWVVVEGTAKVIIENDVKILTEGQSCYIPITAKHRMENTGEVPMVIIEVQTGTYLGEDDIFRYEDMYSRN